uniref:tRNA pseudouridine synthase n=1 Tax=Strigamia maritima TaxID=126957 RepID=T1J0V5_STRMM
MRRFLIRFAYIGSRFCGLQRQPNSTANNYPSVQGILENAVRRLYPKNDAVITTSSRTDKGVHALMNTSHVDLEHPKEGHEYDSEWIKEQLNRSLRNSGHDMIVTDVFHVNSEFHCRFSAVSRSYVYRIALTDSTDDVNHTRIPIAELDRCYFIRPPLCEASLHEAAHLLSGLRDFKCFTSKSNDENQTKDTLRIVEVRVCSSSGFMSAVDQSYEGISFYDLHFKSRGFLYNQVRRMTSVMLATAQGRSSLADIYYLFDCASENNWPSHLTMVPAHGLYLRQIEYKESDLLPP